jgi:Pentapeptide repeats (8 copies)
MNRFAATVTSAAVALGLLLIACVALLPGWIVGDAALPVADRLRAENDVRATLLQGVAGLLALAGLALGASVTLRQVRVSRDDVGGAMAVLGRRTMVLPGTGIELERTDLRGAELAGRDFSRFCFAGANLDGAVLTGCDLSDATFTGATLRNAVLTDATLTRADLAGADLTGADLEGVRGLAITKTDS